LFLPHLKIRLSFCYATKLVSSHGDLSCSFLRLLPLRTLAPKLAASRLELLAKNRSSAEILQRDSHHRRAGIDIHLSEELQAGKGEKLAAGGAFWNITSGPSNRAEDFKNLRVKPGQ
jgi:hypothetical protein